MDDVFGADAIDPNSLKLHQKLVFPIAQDKVDSLSSVDPAAVSGWLHSKGWLNDVTRYELVPFDGKTPQHRMLPGDIDRMLEVGVIRRLEPGEMPQGAVRLFFVIEMAKERRRPIKWPRDINDALGRATLLPLPVVPRAVVRHHIRGNPWAIVVDMKQWFDQLQLSREVGLHMCFDAGPGFGICCLDRLPMGQRHATEVATAVMRRLLDFACHATVDYAADNVRFVGTRDAVLAAFCEFAARCSTVGAQLNEIDVDEVVADPSKAESLLTQEYGFLGEQYNHRDNTMCSTKKTVEKLQATWARQSLWTHRQMATHFGVLFYASSTSRIGIYAYHSAMRFFSQAMGRLQLYPSLWDEPVGQLPQGVLDELSDWTETALRNVPVPIPWADQHVAKKIICVDASGWGWSASCLDVASGHVNTHMEQWLPASGLIGAGSTLTEPSGALRAVCRFINPRSSEPILILTDHDPLVGATQRGYAACWAYNQMIRGLQDFACPKAFQHIEGESNPMDAGSRGIAAPDPEVCADAIRRLAVKTSWTPSARPFAAPFVQGRGSGAGTGYAGNTPIY